MKVSFKFYICNVIDQYLGVKMSTIVFGLLTLDMTFDSMSKYLNFKYVYITW